MPRMALKESVLLPPALGLFIGISDGNASALANHAILTFLLDALALTIIISLRTKSSIGNYSILHSIVNIVNNRLDHKEKEGQFPNQSLAQ
jgi:hypothetical protein